MVSVIEKCHLLVPLLLPEPVPGGVCQAGVGLGADGEVETEQDGGQAGHGGEAARGQHQAAAGAAQAASASSLGLHGHTGSQQGFTAHSIIS